MPFNQTGPSNYAHFAGTYNDVTGNQIHNVYNIDTSTTLSRLKAILNPAHLPGGDRPTCLRGTRTHIRGQISEFMNGKSCESNIVFLLGAAGTGKSTIATAIADTYRRAKRLGCHLFFLREKSDPMTVIQTIAYNLAASNEFIALAIDKALRNYGDLSSATLDSLFNILLHEPLSSVASRVSSPVLIILDALDECGTSESRKSLLYVLTKNISTLPRNFYFLITSRPEIDILSFVSSIKHYIIDLDMLPDENMKDVCTYISHELNVKKKTGQLVLPNNWPWEENMRKLVETANGSFIWASTAIRFIEGRGEGGFEALEALILNKSLNLDDLYESVLRNSLTWTESTKTNFPNVFSLIFFGKKPLNDNEIDGILNLKEGTTRSILCRLRSLVFFAADQNIRIHHASFYDYLVFRTSREQFWYIDAKRQKEMIVEKCFGRMGDFLRFNICGLESSFLLNNQIIDLQERIERNIPKHLRYICCYWGHHIQDTPYSPELGNLLNTFAYEKLLFWFEVLSLTDTFDDHVGIALTYAISWIGNKDTEMSAFLRDAYRKASTFSEAISRSAPHIYCSLLPLTIDESVVSLHYKGYANPVAHVEYTGDRQRSAVIKVIERRSGNLSALSFSPDGTRIVSITWDNEVCMWDAASGKLIAALEHKADTIAFSPSGDLVALTYSYGKEGVIAVWNPIGGEIVRELCTDYTASVYCITFSKSGKFIASGYRDGNILIWDVESGRIDGNPLEGHTNIVSSVSFSYDDQYLVSGSDGGTIVLWNFQSRTMVYSRLFAHTIRVITIAFSPNAEYFVSGSNAGIAWIQKTSTGEVIQGLEGCREAIYSSDGLQILGFNGINKIKIWNMLNVDEPPREINTGYERRCVAFAPDGTRFAFSSGGSTIEIWDATVSVLNTKRSQVQSGVASLAVSPRGRYIASGGWYGTICVWNTANGMLIAGPWKGHSNRVTSVAFSPDEELVASGSYDRAVRVWKALSGESVTVFEGHTEYVRSVAFSPNGKQIASGSNDCTIRVWSVERGKLALTPFKGHRSYVISVAYSPDGSKIVSGSVDRTVRIWNATTGQLLSTLKGHSDTVLSVAYFPDGLRIASRSNDGTMRLWNAKSGANESVIRRDDSDEDATLGRFSPDGKLILSGAIDGTIRVWDSSTNELLFEILAAHSGWVTSLSFFPDNKHLVSSSDDKTIRFWSLDDADWDLRRRDGWVVDKDNRLLMWLPKHPRKTLITPRNPVIMNVPYNTRADFSPYLVGNEWTRPIVVTSE